MKNYRIAILSLILVYALILGSCSKIQSPIEPSQNQNLPDSKTEFTGNRTPIAVYDAVIDPVNQTFTITPDRESTFHYPLSNIYPATMQIVATGWTPTFWADIKISHPFPGSGVVVFDPRVIAILPANPGVSFNYPVNGVTGNNSVVYQPDGYTKLFDNLGGSIPGNVNPFKAYMKSMPYRAWLSTGSKVSETQRWYMNLAGFGGPQTYKLVLDVSTNYPAPPHQVTDNAPEPVQITNTVEPGLTSQGGTSWVWTNLIRWNGNYQLYGVGFEAPDIFDGTRGCLYQSTGPNLWNVLYWGTITNEKLAPVGTYKMLTVSSDTPTGIAMYYESTYEVKPPDPVVATDVTPQKVNFSPEDAVINGEFLYMACGVNGLIMWSVYEQYMNWYTGLKIPNCDLRAVDYSDGYAYVVDYALNKLYVVDVYPYGYCFIAKTVDLPSTPYDIDIDSAGDYAFIANGTSGLQIVDIQTPESAVIYKSVPTIGSARGACVLGDYAYVADYSGGMSIIQINPISAPVYLRNVPTPGSATKVAAAGNYAYVLDETMSLQVIKAQPYGTASIVKTITFPDQPSDINISQNYAYISDNMYNLEIVDITTPENASRYRAVDTPLFGTGLTKYDRYAWVFDKNAGVEVYDVYNPGSPTLVNTYLTAGATQDVSVANDYFYTAGDMEGFQVSSMGSDPPAPMNYKFMYPATNVLGMDIEGDIAVLGCKYQGIAIYDLTPQYSETLLKTLDTPGLAREVDIVGNYAYVADDNFGLTIVNINPPSSAYIVKSVDTPGNAMDVCVSGNYAYVADGTGGLQIININSPTSASIVKSVAMPDIAYGVAYASGYAYIGANASGFQIVDVDPVGSASIVKSVDTPGESHGLMLLGDYAFVADGSAGLQNIKINPVSSAAIFSTADTPGTALDVYVKGELAYVADCRGGVRAIDLW